MGIVSTADRTALTVRGGRVTSRIRRGRGRSRSLLRARQTPADGRRGCQQQRQNAQKREAGGHAARSHRACRVSTLRVDRPSTASTSNLGRQRVTVRAIVVAVVVVVVGSGPDENARDLSVAAAHFFFPFFLPLLIPSWSRRFCPLSFGRGKRYEYLRRTRCESRRKNCVGALIFVR